MSALQREGSGLRTLLDRLDEGHAQTERIFRGLSDAELTARPIRYRHRLLFYLGHLEAFDWNLLAGRLGAKTVNGEFDSLFAFGIDPGADNLPNESIAAWPALSRIREYAAESRRRLRNSIEVAIKFAPDESPNTSGSLPQLLNVAVEHRLMHAETLAYLLNYLPRSEERPVGDGEFPSHQATDPAGANGMVRIPAGTATLGMSREEELFGWDNEFGAQLLAVPEFSINRCMVSNAEYLRFVLADGYRARELWSDADWQWRREQAVECPAFWRFLAGHWYYRAPHGLIPLPPDRPVYVSHAEASAYARWKGLALPTEAQWHRAAYGTPQGVEREYPWGNEAPTARHGNFDFHSWLPAAVDAYPQGSSAFGVTGMLGNGWEWTADTFGALPGFEPFEFYPGYSADFFDARHYVMKGGSPRTAACMLRRSFRNWFQPHYPYIYAGFRCVGN